MFDKNKLQELNFQNLISVSPLLKNIEYFIFYGTLLGIIRENNIIKLKAFKIMSIIFILYYN